MNGGLLEKLTSAGSVFLIWHFMTLVLCVTGLLLEKALRKGNPHVRSSLLRLTLLLAVAIPLVCSIWDRLPPAQATPAPSVQDKPEPVSSEQKLPSSTEIDWDHAAVWRPMIADVGQIQDHLVTNTKFGLPLMQIFYATLLGFSSLASFYLLARLVLAVFRCAALRRRGKPLEASEQSRCRIIASAMRVSAPQVLQVDGLESPLLLGFFKAVILLPGGVQARDEIYGHELTHLRRHDMWWHLFARLATIFMPLQPGFWLLKMALERADEDVCDDMVLVQGANRSAYAELLLNVAESQHSPCPDLCLSMAAFRSQLERRLDRLMDTGRPLAGRLSLASLGLCLPPLLVVGAFTAVIYLDAERPLLADDSDSPLAALAQNYTQMQNVNISYEASISLELSPYYMQNYAKENAVTVEPNWQEHVFFCADKKGFDLEVSRLGKNGGFRSFSYDGTTYAALDGRGGEKILQISKKSVKVPPAVWNSDPLLLPAALLAKSHNTYNQIDCLWPEVTDPGFWATAPTAFPLTNGGELSGMVNGNKMTATVPDQGSPLGISGWESRQGASDKPWKKYTCTEIGEVSFEDNGQKRTFVFPKKAVFQMFDKKGELMRTDTLEITKISLNDPSFDESKFSIDPASVRNIYDTDSRKWVKPVPKGGGSSEVLEAQPFNDNFIAQPNDGSGRALLGKLKSISISVNFNKTDVGAVLQYFSAKSKELDPDKKGINFVLGDFTPTPENHIHREVTILLENVPLDELLRYVTEQTNLKCSIEDNAVYFRP